MEELGADTRPTEAPGGGVAFAAIKPTFSEASAQLVEQMRATLRHAQEISTAVGEAEAAAASAREAAAVADAAVLEEELQIEREELERLLRPQERSAIPSATPSATPAPPMAPASSLALQPSSVNAAAPSSASSASPSDSAAGLAAVPTGSHLGSAGGAPIGSASPRGGRQESVASQMTQEVETTIMWVQQLLESVHLIESDTPLQPGASLLSIVQPRPRHQKDEALQQSLALFREKKETEEEADERAAAFRRQALEAVAAQRAQ